MRYNAGMMKLAVMRNLKFLVRKDVRVRVPLPVLDHILFISEVPVVITGAFYCLI